MNVAELILKYIEILIYPLLVLVVFFSLKNQIKDMLNGKLSAKYKDFSIEIENKEKEIQSIQENIRTVSGELEEELKKVSKSEKWSGFDHDMQRLSEAFKSLDINPQQHRLINFIRRRGGFSSVAELVEEIIKPGKNMEAHEFQAKKQMLDLAIERLMEKGVLSKSEKGKLRVHPLFSKIANESPKNGSVYAQR